MANSGQYRTSTPENKQSFTDTASGQERRLVRHLVKKAKSMSKIDREILTWLADRWFYHRAGKGVIHPGVDKIAKAVERCARTVRYTLARLREWGFIVPVQYEKGGRRSTRYMVDVSRILTVLGNIPETVEGDLVNITPASDSAEKPCNSCSRNNNRLDQPKPAEGARWFTSRFRDGLVAGLSRWIDPDRWRNRQEIQAKQRKSQSLAWEVPF